MCGDDQNGKGKAATELKKNKPRSLQESHFANAPKGSGVADPNNWTNCSTRLIRRNPRKAKRTWEMVNFYHNPVVATVALLHETAGDVRNAESQVIDELLTSVDKNIVKLDKLNVKVIANSTVVTIGSSSRRMCSVGYFVNDGARSLHRRYL